MKKSVNFEIAKLLKDKECVIKPLGLKNSTDYVEGYEWDCEDKNDTVKITEFQFEDHVCYFRYLKPTIAEVVMWLYEKHGIWVYTKPVLDEDGEWIFKGYVKHLNDFKAKEYQTKLLREPTGAYEAAITYTLENLIQGGNNEP